MTSVGLHPVWLMFALLAFGSLFGFTGLILAVPIAATLGVIIRFAIERYRNSALYHGGLAPQPGALIPCVIRRARKSRRASWR